MTTTTAPPSSSSSSSHDATTTNTELLDQFEKEVDSSVWKTSTDSCLSYFDQMSFCFSPANQFRYYYTYGLTDTCDTQVDDFWRCIRYKLKGTPPPSGNEEKQQQSVPKREHLWTFRETPPSVFAFPETEWRIPDVETNKRTFI